MIKNIILLCAFILIWTSCDEFTGYNYTVEKSQGSTSISGTITDMLTGQAIPDARILIGYAQTETDSAGQFNLDYVLSVDEKRDQPVPVSVNKPDYFQLDTSLVLYDIFNVVDLQLEFGRPTIRLIWTGIYVEDYVRQALIYDPQGIQNIEQVSTDIYFEKMGETEYHVVSHVMAYKSTVDQNSACYQISILPFLPDDWGITERKYRFSVTDKDGFMHVIDEKDESVISSEMLCTP